jgi:Icc-related predicted phosphoesterase
LQALRLLAFSDLHRDRRQAARLVDMAASADVVIGAGDYASNRLGLVRTIDALSGIGKPTVLVPGNNETDVALWRACAGFAGARVLHGEAVEIDGVCFFGLGGGVPPTPLPWSFDLSEDEAAEALARCPADAVLVVHSPPRGCVDVVFGRHLGSRAVRAAIERTRPRLVLCGHIHQAWRQEESLAGSRVVNVGPEGMYFEV